MRFKDLDRVQKEAIQRLAKTPDGEVMIKAMENEVQELREKNDKVSDTLVLGRNQGAILSLSDLLSVLKG